MKAGASAELSFLAGGGEMGARTRAMDWSRTDVGPLRNGRKASRPP
jgi:hypothetical protein